jgi:hypothetical protein
MRKSGINEGSLSAKYDCDHIWINASQGHWTATLYRVMK